MFILTQIFRMWTEFRQRIVRVWHKCPLVWFITESLSHLSPQEHRPFCPYFCLGFKSQQNCPLCSVYSVLELLCPIARNSSKFSPQTSSTGPRTLYGQVSQSHDVTCLTFCISQFCIGMIKILGINNSQEEICIHSSHYCIVEGISFEMEIWGINYSYPSQSGSRKQSGLGLVY